MNSKLGKRRRREQAGRDRIYHGGGRGLAIGDSVLCAAETGRSNCSGQVPDYRSDRVYVTPHLQDAQYFASKDNEDPVVYVVEPVGSLEPDGDNKNPGRSFACRSAKILAVIKISPKKIRQARNAARIGAQMGVMTG